ncbi:MAG: type II toxin-antitoxin system RelB/DinJ family antitoxin [Campylobacteraceae bacterium]|jgi:DNA-damage-inducible protein J|nr:type II toxin-antitoxin system RelB/DinJ family antitoxin [Campylobacteraceae bacterium]
MITKISIIRARIDPVLKEKAVKILNEQGLTLSEAIRLMLNQVTIQKTLPFKIKSPNKTTIKTFKKTDKNIDVVKVKNTEELFEKLDI